MTLAPWMLSASIFAYATNIGLSIMHAFGYGLPLVSSDDLRAQGPEVEALRAGENCLLYRALDANDFAAKCQKLLTDHKLRAACGAAGRRAVLQKYTIGNMVQGFLDATRLVDGRQRQVEVPTDLAALSRCDAGQAVS
jgi:glycosyltransferase involved in cell wall biosynthesis